MGKANEQRLTERLAAHRKIGVDSSIFIYQVESHLLYQPLAHIVLSGIVEARFEGVTSVITLMELTVHPWRANLEMIAREYETLLVHFPNLRLVEIDRDVARRAARLRARFGLHTPDALQVASAMIEGATAFVTNDFALQRLNEVIEIILLRDYGPG